MTLANQQLKQVFARLGSLPSEQSNGVDLSLATGRTPRSIPWLAIILVFGMSLRGYHYLSNPPVWHDEAAQIYNVLNKDYSEMLGPLFYAEACPPLFLAVEKAVAWLLGDSTFALRLVPFSASCAALVALVLLARTMLPRTSLLWFAMLLACSDRLLWHASEAKPYAVDVLVATGMLAVGLKLERAARLAPYEMRGWLALCAVLSPVLVFLSFPACFMLGGLGLALLPDVWRMRSRSTWLLYVSFGVLLCGSFLLLWGTAIKAQKNDLMLSCWEDKFPAWVEPLLVPIMAVVRLSEVARYALEPVGNIFCPLAVVGGVTLWRRGWRRLIGILLLPIGLNLLAWLAASYPLGATRVDVYAVPAVVLLIAAGIPPTLAWLRRLGPVVPLVLVLALVVPVVVALGVFFKPWARLDSATPTAYVLAHRDAAEPVVGTLWEQRYYCRRLGPFYRALADQPQEPQSLPAAALAIDGTPTGEIVESLWLLTFHDSQAQADHVASLEPGRPWQVVERYVFRDVVVLRVRRGPPP